MASNFKNFDYTYGVGMEFKATSAKQVKDLLKTNLDSLSKLVKDYNKVLKIDPNADLSKLFAEMQKIKGVVDGINGSANPFSGFVDKGLLGRIASLEHGLQSVSAISNEVKSSMSGLRDIITSVIEPLKASGQIKFPATFDNLFGNIADKSAEIKNVVDQIDNLTTKLSNLNSKKISLDDSYDLTLDGVDLKQVKAWISEFHSLEREIAKSKSFNIDELYAKVSKLSELGANINAAIGTFSEADFSKIGIDFGGASGNNLFAAIENIPQQIDNLVAQISKKKSELDSQLEELKAVQDKYNTANTSRVSSGKKIGIQSEYSAQVTVTPKANDAEWAKKINDTIKNIEPQLKPITLTPTFLKSSKNVSKEIDGSLAQIQHTIDLDLKISNLKEFQKKIELIDQSVRNAKAQIAKNSEFKFRFEFEEGKEFKDKAYDIINKFKKDFKKFDTTFNITNKKSFLSDIRKLQEAAKTGLKNIPAEVVIGNRDSIFADIEKLRTEISDKIGTIGVNLNIQNMPQFIAQAAMMKDAIDETYANGQSVTTSATSGADTDITRAEKGIVELSDKAKEAQANIEKIKSTLKSLTEHGFKSPDFLKLGAFDENFKHIKGSKNRLEELLTEYETLYKKTHASKEELRNTYGANDAGYEEYSSDMSMLQQLEEIANSVLQRQIEYAQAKLSAAEKILEKETQITNAKKEQARVESTDSSSNKTTQQLAMSAEEAAKKVRSLNGTITQQKRILKDLEANGIGSKSFLRLGEWDKTTSSFKKNSQEIQELVKRYNELRQARIDAGGKTASGEEASLRGKLSAILREQKKHAVEIIAKNQEELASVKQIVEAYKQAGTYKSKTKTSKTDVGVASESKQLDDLISKLNKAKETLASLKANKFDALGSTGLGDVNNRLEALGSKQSFEELIDFYNKLIAKRNELEKAGQTGSDEYIKYAKVYEMVEQQLNIIYQDQLKYTQSRISQLESEITKEKEVLRLKQEQTKEDVKHSGSAKNKTSAASGTSHTTVKLDGATLNSLAKDSTLKTIDGKLSNILQQLGSGVVINGSNISIEASNVSVSGKGTSSSTGSKSAGQDSGEKEVKLSTISSYSQQLVALEERIKRTGLYTDDLQKKFEGLRSQLNAINVQDDADTYKFDLDRFKEDFEQLKTYDKLYQEFIKSQAKQIQLNDQIATSDGPTAQLEEQLKAEEEISRSIEEQLNKYTSLYDQRARQLAIDEAIKIANQEIAKVSAAKSDKDITKLNNDLAKIVDNIQKQFDQMKNSMNSAQVPMADSAIAKLQQYEQLLETLKNKQNEIAANPDLLKNSAYSEDFNSLLQQIQKVYSELGTLQKSSENFFSKIQSINDIKPLGVTFDATNLQQLHDAMQNFANQAGNGTAKLIEFNDVERTATFEIKNGKGQVQQLTIAYDEATNSLGRYVSKTKESVSESQKFVNSLKHSFQNVARYVASFGSVYRIFAMIKQGITYVKEIDTALTELKKVTDETDASYDKFLQDMSKTAGVVGSTVKDLTTMSAEWARLGYSMEEAGKLAESTAILLNVSEFEDATKASEALISTMQAFSYTADQSEHVVDILNEVGNNFAISSDGIATALQHSASALMEGGNNLEQATALVAAANKVVQDPNSVGSALRTISLRLRGTSVKVLEEMGEETEGVIESVSKLQAKVKAISGVDILTDTGDYKDTYTILKEIGTVWENMADIDQAALLELMAGKNRANTLSAILGNMEDLEGAYESAMNAEGSAANELNTYLDSIQGRVDLFNNSVQTMWMNFINDDAAKTLVDIGRFLVDAVDQIGVIKSIIAGIVVYISLIKKQNLSNVFSDFLGFKKNKINLLEGQALDNEIAALNTALSSGAQALGQYKIKAKEAGNGMDVLVSKIESGVIQTNNGKVSAEQYTIALQGQSEAAQKAARAEKLKNIAIGAFTLAITGIISAIKSYADSIKTVEERYEELQSSLSKVESDLNDFNSELEAINEQIEELSNKNLTITEAEELRKLKEQSAELEKQKELREETLKAYQKQEEQTSLKAMENLIKTTKAGQQAAKETGKTVGKIIGYIADAALIIGGLLVTGASFGGATPLGVAMMGAGMSGVGASAGEWLGGTLSGGKSAESLTEWYDSYTEAINKKEQEAAEAEGKYLDTLSDKSYDKWQKKLDEISTLKEDMYNNLSQMQEYIDSLEYNDQTKSTIDEFNNLMTHISVTSMDGNIDAQISSIESLKDEYYQLSRGVDEHGNNVALTSEEYARYQAIISQVLGYNTGLTQSFDENGNAILRTADAQYTYNQLLAQSIELLRQQQIAAQQAAAVQAVYGENAEYGKKKTYDDNAIVDAYKNEKVDVDTSHENIYQGVPENMFHDVYDDNEDKTNGKDFGRNKAEDVVAKTIGVKADGFFNGEAYDVILENWEKIIQKRDDIEKAINKAVREAGYSKSIADQYTAEYMKWLDSVVQQAQDAENQTAQNLIATLQQVPQTLDAYYDLDSGASVDFINKYIASYVKSFDDVSNLTDKEIKEMRDHIKTITEKVAGNEGLQSAIEEMYTLDANKIPVNAYTKKLKDLTAQLIEEGIIDKKDVNTDGIANMLADVFVGDTTIKEMQDEIAKKLKTDSKGLVNNLTVAELRVAYKIIPDLDDDLTFEELRREIQERLPQATGPIVQTYSTLVDQVEQFNEAVAQTSEIVLNNTQVTQEYKDSLVALGVSEEELAECFDATNDLVVVNAENLHELVNSAKKNTVQNTQLARSQARLQYYELYKKMQSYISAEGKIVDGKKKEITSLYQEMNALEKTIARYSMLEVKLLGTTSAYERFQKAQETDSETDYISGAEDMVVALGKAFNTAELGTEAARTAISGLVPSSVYEDLDTVQEKMDAIYDYFRNGKISEYFTLEFDDDGNIQSAEMKLGNMQKFIEDGLANGVFEGDDWTHFELSDEIDSIDEFAEKMKVSKDVAFAFIKAVEDHDIEWLNGDYSTMFDKLVPETLEGNIFGAMEKIADLNAQLAEGKIKPKEYAEEFAKLNDELNAAKKASRENLFGKDGVNNSTPDEIGKMNIDDIDNYLDANQRVVIETEHLNEATDAYQEAVDALNDAKEEGREATEEEIEAEKKAKKALEEASEELDKATKKKNEFSEPTEAEIQIALDDIEGKIAAAKGQYDAALNKYFTNENGYYVINSKMKSELEKDDNYNEIMDYVALLNSRTQLTATVDGDQLQTEVDKVREKLTNIVDTLKNINISLDDESVKEIGKQLGELFSPRNIVIGIGGAAEGAWNDTWNWITGGGKADGTAHARGTAFAGGSWGAPRTETALTGELGPEILVRNGRWTTVGENGAEFTQIKKGDIIFNHKQSEQLLKHGYVTGRGKAFVGGTAYNLEKGGVTIYPDQASKTEFELTDALNDASDSAEEFAETMDWVAVRIEEISDKIALNEAKLENATSVASKNKIIDKMISDNQTLYDNLLAGANEYYAKAKTYLSDVPKEYREAAKNGSIALTDFKNEVGEEAYNAIEAYREWVQKGDDLTLQAEQTLTEIADLAKQAFDNISSYYDNKSGLAENKNEKLQAAVDLTDEQGNPISTQYYQEMKNNTNRQIELKQEERDRLQTQLDNDVKSGIIDRGSPKWFDAVNEIYAVDTDIINLNKDLESYQNSINEIYWDNFEEGINRIEYLEDETQNLIDLMGNIENPVDDNGEWTNEGITAMGLYAQQMEMAEYKSKQYANAINDLNKDYAAGKYSQSEYYEKLNELKKGQNDAIKSYYDAQDAIKDLNKTRVDAIKNGIDKEIEAYDKLISKKKEELSSEKDLYDFQKSVQKQQKNISDIKRKLAALEGDNSASAVAQRKKLKAELAEAEAEQEELFYNRSIENQQKALDTENENFKEAKEQEKTEWDEWLENTDAVMTESLSLVQENSTLVYDTLKEKADEYGLSLSDAVVTPWSSAQSAIDSYNTKFGESANATTSKLAEMKAEWQNVIAAMDTAAGTEINRQKEENKKTTAAKKDTPKTPTTPTNPTTPTDTAKTIKEGGKINAKGAKIYGSKGGTAYDQYFSSDPIYTVLDIDGKWLKVRHHKASSGVTGWFKKSDVKAYAKGTLGAKKSQLALIDELGEELQLVPGQNGRLEYVKKGTGIVPADLTERLMDLAMNPQEVLDRNRPTIGASPAIHNTEINLNITYGNMVSIAEYNGGNIEELKKMVSKQFEKHTKDLNSALRKYTR